MQYFSSILLLALYLTLSATASAGSSYVTDILYVPIRSGTTGGHRIVRTLKSGDKVKVLTIQNEYSKILTANGDEGWLKSRYLQEEPVAKDQLAELQTQLERYEAKR